MGEGEGREEGGRVREKGRGYSSDLLPTARKRYRVSGGISRPQEAEEMNLER